MPVTFKDGEWSVFKHVTVEGELEERLQLLAGEIAEVHQGHKAPKGLLNVFKCAGLCSHVGSFFHRRKNSHLKN